MTLLRFRQTVLLAGLCMITGCRSDTSVVPTEEAHEHGGTAVTLWTDRTELFFEYPPLIAGEPGGAWAIHLTRLEDFSPVTEGVLTLAFRAPDGTVFTTASEAPARAGIYTPSPSLPAPGVYDLVVDIRGEQLVDRMAVGTVQVFQAEADIPHEAEDAQATTISFLKEQQWPIPFATERATPRDVEESIGALGEIVEAAGRVAEVASPVSGLILAGDNLNAPAVGDRVRRGQPLVTLAPTFQDDSFARTRAEFERLTRDLERLERLYAVEAIPEKRVVEARHDLELAQAALDAIGGAGDGYTYPLHAPIDGVVQERWFHPGARVDVGHALYLIADTRQVWLRVRLPARHAAMAGEITGATFTVEGMDRSYRAERIVSVGNIIDAQSRTFTILLSVANPDQRLKIGHIADVRVYAGALRQGVSIPDSAILTEDGLPVAYVQVGGETFERRLLTLGPGDGAYTLIEQGIAADEHVVTVGAYQVYLASLNTSEISDHGHPH